MHREPALIFVLRTHLTSQTPGFAHLCMGQCLVTNVRQGKLMFLRLLELVGISDRDENRACSLILGVFLLVIALSGVAVFSSCLRSTILRTVTRKTYRGKCDGSMDNVNGTIPDPKANLYCPNGCQGACACPVLDNWRLNQTRKETGELMRMEQTRQRVRSLIATMLIFPEYLTQILVEDEGLTDALEQKLEALKARGREAMSLSSSLAMSMASDKLNDAVRRRAGSELLAHAQGSNVTVGGGDFRHAEKRTFKKLLGNVKDVKDKGRSGTI